MKTIFPLLLAAAALAGCSKPAPLPPVKTSTGEKPATTRDAAFRDNPNVPDYIKQQAGGQRTGPRQ